MKETQTDGKSRLEALRQMLREGTVGTQEEICEALKRKKFPVTQSTISRDLRRVGAVKVNGGNGETVYRLAEDQYNSPVAVVGQLVGLIRNIQHNDAMIVVHTSPGSASLIARQLDAIKPEGVIGTLAGDDTVFVAISSAKLIPHLIRSIRQEFSAE